MKDYGIGVKCVMVVQKEGLNEEGFVEDLKEYGEVWDREDNILDTDPDSNIPVRMFYIKTDFGKYVKLKLDYMCVEPRRFVLFPMMSLNDKIKVMEIKVEAH